MVLYTSFWHYLLGKRPEPDSRDAAWRKLQGMLSESSHQIKMNLKHAKVLCTWAWQTLAPIQVGLQNGDFDMVTSARTWMANPTMAGKLVAASAAGEKDLEPERPCTMCNNCLMAAPAHRASCQDETRFLPGTLEEQREIIRHGNAKCVASRRTACWKPTSCSTCENRETRIGAEEKGANSKNRSEPPAARDGPNEGSQYEDLMNLLATLIACLTNLFHFARITIHSKVSNQQIGIMQRGRTWRTKAFY